TTNSSYDFLNEKGKLSIGIGANYGFSISKKIIVNAGIGYDNIKLVLDNTPLTFNRFITQPFTFNTSLGSIMVDAATMKDGFSSPSPTFPTQYKISYNYTQSLNFITIPLNIGYKIIDNKIRITAFAGIHTQFLIKQKTTLTLIKERNNNIVQFNNFDINQLNTAGNLGLQIQISTKRKLNLYFEPTYKFNFKSLSNEGIIASKTSLLGLHIGVVKNL
ncbi:MAG: outer membrane beta-barrel protein, partial [Chitinophagaceae bacterium]|nr:outer membrane beta-barrel protein [Chitinophagaceae bacterium]